MVPCTRQKLYQPMYRATAAFRLSSFLVKPLVKRVKRRKCIRKVKFDLST